MSRKNLSYLKLSSFGKIPLLLSLIIGISSGASLKAQEEGFGGAGAGAEIGLGSGSESGRQPAVPAGAGASEESRSPGAVQTGTDETRQTTAAGAGTDIGQQNKTNEAQGSQGQSASTQTQAQAKPAESVPAKAAPSSATTVYSYPASSATPVAVPLKQGANLKSPAGLGAPEAKNLKEAQARAASKQAALLKAAKEGSLAKPTIKQGIGNPKNDDVLKEIFALTEKPRTQESMDQIFALERDGQALLAKSDFQKALIKFQDMYAMSKDVKYGDGEGRSLERMASIYLSRGEKTRAKSLVENAMEILSISQDKKALGHTRVTAAQVYLALDNPLWALRQLDEAMKDFSSSSVSDNEEAARAMLLAAELATRVDQMKEAVKFYRAAAVYFGQCGNHAMEVNLHNTVAGLLQEMGLTTAALEEGQKALAIARDQKAPHLIAASLTQVASCQYALCEFMNARKSMEEISQYKLDKQPALAFSIMSEAYGHALAATGSMDAAKVYLETAWKFMKDGAPAIHKSQVLNALGVINTHLGNFTIAVEQLRQASDAQSTIGKGHERFGVLIAQNTATALSRSGENRKARAELEGVLRTMSKWKEPDQLILGQVYSALAEICFHLKEIPQADAYLKKSIEVAGKINDDSTLWRNYVVQAKMLSAQQLPCTESLNSAASCFRSPQAGVFTNAEVNPYVSSRDELSSDLINMLLSNNLVEQAFITAEQVKEESFITEWQRSGGEVKAADRELYNDLVLQRAHLHAAEASTTPDKVLKRWAEWMRRHQVLSAENRELARLISPVPLNLAELVKKAQDSQSTVLDYVLGPKQSFVFIIDSAGRLGASKLAIGRSQLKAQVGSMLQLSSKSGLEFRQSEKRLLQTLHNELVPEHVSRFLPKNPDQLLVFIPDSVLFNLPMAALVDAQGKYLIESHTITTLPAMLSFLDNESAYASDLSLLINASNEGRESQEASELSTIFQGEQLVKLEGQTADLSQLQEQAKSNFMLHFSAPLLLQESTFFKAPLPMKAQGGDKAATADLLFKLNLPSELAVWSGTSVSPKDSQGGAVKVLSRGLAYAGIRNVLLSLWVEHNPERTQELLEFYKGRQQGLSQAQSLRKAQLLALAKDPSPRAWAAFQLIGMGR